MPSKPSNQPQSSVSSSEDDKVENDTIEEEQVEVESVKDKKQPISSKPVAAAVVKRSLEINKESKKKKKMKVFDVEEKGKKLIEMVFSANDEIVVLKGLVDLKKMEIFINSNNNMNDLLDLIKGLLGFEANVNQLNNKVQSLHQKFHNNAKRTKQPGEIPKISNPHELESYKLSNEIWGDEIGTQNGALEDNQSGKAVGKKKMLVSQAISPMLDLTAEEKNVIGCQYQYLDQFLKPRNYLALPVPPACLTEMCGSSKDKAQAFDKKWRSLIMKETEAYLERVALVQEQTRWMLDVDKSSDS